MAPYSVEAPAGGLGPSRSEGAPRPCTGARPLSLVPSRCGRWRHAGEEVLRGQGQRQHRRRGDPRRLAPPENAAVAVTLHSHLHSPNRDSQRFDDTVPTIWVVSVSAFTLSVTWRSCARLGLRAQKPALSRPGLRGGTRASWASPCAARCGGPSSPQARGSRRR